MINVFTVEGNVTQQPQVKQVGQTQVTTFAIACHRNYKNKQTGEYDSDFFNIDVWGQQAQFVSANVGKGDRVIVTGEMKTQTRTNQQGQNTTYYNVNATQVSLARKTGNNGQQGGQGGYNQRPQNNYQQPPQQQQQAPQGNPFNQPSQGGQDGFPPANGFPQAPQAPQAPGNENIDLDDNDLPF